MSRISSVFRKLDRAALIAYITAGYPSIEYTLKMVPVLIDNGCDIVELGIPFSDPLADGATIQKASFNALKNGITPEICMKIAAELRQRVDTPIIFMTYLNPVFNYGYEKFCHDCAASGIDGLIIPDLPPDEDPELEVAAEKHAIDLIYLLAPTSIMERIELVVKKSKGFIYLVSVTGVTGTRDRLPSDLPAFVSRVKTITSQPVCIGFGISNPEQAAEVSRIADGIIVGSRIIQIMETEKDAFKAVGEFIKQLRNSISKK